eukprot:TRINITY_DN5366_c0_g1_i1.p1 TRINITY_DN5366_c0_g1~~TRINITY_DN5366_c0_g1_i1.p1  ORF type:complete len:263 (+),score=38.68 TRINITY_DN5366_c0_g1_i1:33-791(+)
MGAVASADCIAFKQGFVDLVSEVDTITRDEVLRLLNMHSAMIDPTALETARAWVAGQEAVLAVRSVVTLRNIAFVTLCGADDPLAVRDEIRNACEVGDTSSDDEAVPQHVGNDTHTERPACSVCFEVYQSAGEVVPLVLGNCGHTFCTRCVDTIKRYAADHTAIKCPTCGTTSSTAKKNFTLIETLEVPQQPPCFPPCSVCARPAPHRCADCIGTSPLYICSDRCFADSHRYQRGHNQVVWDARSSACPRCR